MKFNKLVELYVKRYGLSNTEADECARADVNDEHGEPFLIMNEDQINKRLTELEEQCV